MKNTYKKHVFKKPSRNFIVINSNKMTKKDLENISNNSPYHNTSRSKRFKEKYRDRLW
jgi:hypothetical protein